MPYAITIGAAQIIPKSAFEGVRMPDCHQAEKACMPSFVFSVPGQVNFRLALDHLLACNRRSCASLRRKVRLGMQQKLHWLFEQEAYLGCAHLQPLLYRSHSVANLDKKPTFHGVARHLAHCPHEACATLRRSLLLTVRDNVSPNAKDKIY